MEFEDGLLPRDQLALFLSFLVALIIFLWTSVLMWLYHVVALFIKRGAKSFSVAPLSFSSDNFLFASVHATFLNMVPSLPAVPPAMAHVLLLILSPYLYPSDTKT